MFQNQELQDHLSTSPTVRLNSAVIAEWNLNIAENIEQIGNYRYRPLDPAGSQYSTMPNTFDINDSGNFYTDATSADILIDGGLEDDGQTPITFVSKKEKERMLYSLEDCFQRFRPRSGINKLRYFSGGYSHHTNIDMATRPRYYMAHKGDQFKYWSSYRTEDSIERGIATQLQGSQYYIDDSSPYVVYSKSFAANRIVVKMQTHVGTTDLGPFVTASGTISDPLHGDQNQATPLNWKIQTLEGDNWVDAISFNETSTRINGDQIVGPDGYLELHYGLIIPEEYREIIIFAEEFSNTEQLPEDTLNGYAYLVKQNSLDRGIYHIWIDGIYKEFVPNYGWDLGEQDISPATSFVTDMVQPKSFTDTSNGSVRFREFEEIRGLRLVVQTMNKQDSVLDLIEMSPRLTADLADKTLDFSLTKVASDLGVSGMPVGQLLVSTGSLSLFDYDQSFNTNNPNSIIKDFTDKNLQVKFYEIISNVNGYDYYVPIKTMYAESFGEADAQTRQVSIPLRDLYFYFESITAPQVLIQNASLSYAISVLLDSIGFSNYVFKRVPGEDEEIIPYFFVPPDTSIAQVLNDLAISTQTAMFFDEFNNFVMMSKNYIMPSESDRGTDMTLYGATDFVDSGVIENETTNPVLANIIEITSQDSDVYNSGSINYTSRYIQRSVGSIRQASLIDRHRTWTYKPALLWEVAPTQIIKSINQEVQDQSAYVLGAIPLNSDLSDQLPSVQNNQVVNNNMDLGEGIYWITRYNGYFYANGEVIRYDAVQFNIPSVASANGNDQQNDNNVWITSNQEYQRYFSKLSFNGKIYPTGLVRIYSEPNFETVEGTTRLANGPVAKHGRGQFGTSIVKHYAGVDSYWSDNKNVRGCTMESQFLFGKDIPEISSLGLNAAGVSNSLATKTTRNGIIKNFLSNSFTNEAEIGSLKSTQTGTIQSSALVMNGPSFSTTESPISFISYVNKELDNKYKHFGTRMRLIGRIENSEVRGQTGIGSTTYYTAETNDPSQSINIGGASGGLAVMVNPETNVGYYFEIAALSASNLSAYDNLEGIANVIFYKIMSDGQSKAVPVKLYSGLANIIVDDGKFTGQYRMSAEENPTVYDLAVEYQDIGSSRRFFLYINNKIVATVDDTSPLPIYNNMGIFVRGASRGMFENIYAITNNYSQNTSFALDTPISEVFKDSELDVADSFRRYAMSGVVQASYMSGISSAEPPKYSLYFDEFGTIMREAAYFNVRYDKAYPALYAQLSPTFNRIKGYTVSGFQAGAYGAEFLIFNATDTALSLDETTGNYLRIQGVTFTQQSQNELTVDDYYARVGDFSNPQFNGDALIQSPLIVKEEFKDIKLSRITNGIKEFSLNAAYIQSEDDARSLMGWMISKVLKPRKSIGIKMFANPMIQLGDILSIDYFDDGFDQVADSKKRFVVYNIEYSRDANGPEMNLYLSEVA